MENETYEITSEEQNRDNFTMIPNIIDSMPLSNKAFRLYFHLRRVVGTKEARGRVTESVETMAEWCHMTKPTVIEARKELESIPLIKTAKKREGNFEKITITILDIWDLNDAFFSNSSEYRAEFRSYSRVYGIKKSENGYTFSHDPGKNSLPTE